MLSTSWLYALIWLVEIGLALAALGDAVRHRAAAYVAAGKLTKPVWLLILGLGLLFVLLACPISAILDNPVLSPINLLPLAGLIAASVFLVDARPALQQMRGAADARARTGRGEPPVPSPVRLIRGDITDQRVDVIVNAANSGLLGGGGVDGAIHRRGGPEILLECQRLRATTLPDGLPAGQAVATGAGHLQARWVVHTVGPKWSATTDRSPVLRSAYTESLRVAAELGAHTIAFPAISAGVYGWPLDAAARVAVEAVRSSAVSMTEVRFVLVGHDAYEAFSAAVRPASPS